MIGRGRHACAGWPTGTRLQTAASRQGPSWRPAVRRKHDAPRGGYGRSDRPGACPCDEQRRPSAMLHQALLAGSLLGHFAGRQEIVADAHAAALLEHDEAPMPEDLHRFLEIAVELAVADPGVLDAAGLQDEKLGLLGPRLWFGRLGRGETRGRD